MKGFAASFRLAGAHPAGWGVLASALVASGCADASDPSPSLDPELEGTMTVAPASAVPGEEVSLEFPADSQRGIAFSLAQWSDGQWDERYYLPVRASGG